MGDGKSEKMFEPGPVFLLFLFFLLFPLDQMGIASLHPSYGVRAWHPASRTKAYKRGHARLFFTAPARPALPASHFQHHPPTAACPAVWLRAALLSSSLSWH